ncbi:hypothetical protein KAR91_01170 [Candidatus Pacearchaeota archaeon]|nr:hypothetical protein [Candidatus Pacearchaeota archaeon]
MDMNKWKLSSDGKYYFDSIDGCRLAVDTKCDECGKEPNDVYDVGDSFTYCAVLVPLCKSCFENHS